MCDHTMLKKKSEVKFKKYFDGNIYPYQLYSKYNIYYCAECNKEMEVSEYDESECQL